jgi:hypothetical protein
MEVKLQPYSQQNNKIGNLQVVNNLFPQTSACTNIPWRLLSNLENNILLQWFQIRNNIPAHKTLNNDTYFLFSFWNVLHFQYS